MRIKALIISLCLAGLTGGGVLAFGHHSMAMFDSNKTIKLTGVVTKFSYTNPHVYIYADVEKDGKMVNYRLETGSPYALKEKGWSSRSLQVGDKISILAHPTKDNSDFGVLLSITKANGKKLEAMPGLQEEP